MKNKKSRVKKVLFVCIGNTCRSQMAEGFARALGKKVMEASSAGMAATGILSPEVQEVMEEEGIDISRQTSKQITREMVDQADLVVSLGGCPECNFPDLLEGKLITWPVPDPFGLDISHHRRVRDMIKKKVMDLIIDISQGKTPK